MRVVGKPRHQEKLLEEPRGVRPVPLGRARIGHRLDDLVLRRKRRRPAARSRRAPPGRHRARRRATGATRCRAQLLRGSRRCGRVAGTVRLIERARCGRARVGCFQRHGSAPVTRAELAGGDLCPVRQNHQGGIFTMSLMPRRTISGRGRPDRLEPRRSRGRLPGCCARAASVPPAGAVQATLPMPPAKRICRAGSRGIVSGETRSSPAASGLFWLSLSARLGPAIGVIEPCERRHVAPPVA